MPRKPKGFDQIYQLKITLDESKPPIWRRVQVRSSTKLFELHNVIQKAMPWSNSHLHEFDFGAQSFSDPRFRLEHTRDEHRYRLLDLGLGEGSKFAYVYDFGDNWAHIVQVEKILPAEEGATYPRCLTGRRAAPPDDCGGIYGYYEMLEALQDPEHPEHEMYAEWLPEDFDPAAFDLAATNARLEGLR
jgi:hypothetical protein